MQGCEAFRDCSIVWLRSLVQLLDPVIVLEGDAIFLAAEMPQHLHILTAGTVVLHKGMTSLPLPPSHTPPSRIVLL